MYQKRGRRDIALSACVFSVSQDYLFGPIYAVNRIVHNRGRPYSEYIVHCVARADVNRFAVIDCYVLRLIPNSMHTRLAPRPAPLLPTTTARSDPTSPARLRRRDRSQPTLCYFTRLARRPSSCSSARADTRCQSKTCPWPVRPSCPLSSTNTTESTLLTAHPLRPVSCGNSMMLHGIPTCGPYDIPGKLTPVPSVDVATIKPLSTSHCSSCSARLTSPA
jgi:hypothetical protein